MRTGFMGTSTQVAAAVKVRKSTGLNVVATESYTEGGWMGGWEEVGPRIDYSFAWCGQQFLIIFLPSLMGF